MKEQPDDPKGHTKVKETEKQHWFLTLDPATIQDLLPVFNTQDRKGQGVRTQLYIHPSTEVIATMIRERCPQLKFKINLDVYRSMLYAGRQLFEYVFLRHPELTKKSKRYKLFQVMNAAETELYDMKWLESFLDTLMEGHLSQGTGEFSRDKICGTIDSLKLLLSPELQARCDNFIDEELDSESVRVKVKERLRKREYRERMKNIKLVKAVSS
jgi:hypothetical protein